MDFNEDFDGKPTNLNCFYMDMIFEQKYPKPAGSTHNWKASQREKMFSEYVLSNSLKVMFDSTLLNNKWLSYIG